MPQLPSKLGQRLAELNRTTAWLASQTRIPKRTLDLAVVNKTNLTLAQRETVAPFLACAPSDLTDEPPRRRCYVAGPLSAEHRSGAVNFALAEALLRRKGFDVFNPARISAAMPRERMSRNELMRLGILELSMCDTICMLPDWETSRGATMEHAFAVAANKHVMTLADVDRMPDIAPYDRVITTRVPTPLGDIITYASDDPDHPGIHVDVQNDLEPPRPLALVEFTEDDADPTPTIVTRAWSNVDSFDADVETRHTGTRKSGDTP